MGWIIMVREQIMIMGMTTIMEGMRMDTMKLIDSIKMMAIVMNTCNMKVEISSGTIRKLISMVKIRV